MDRPGKGVLQNRKTSKQRFYSAPSRRYGAGRHARATAGRRWGAGVPQPTEGSCAHRHRSRNVLITGNQRWEGLPSIARNRHQTHIPFIVTYEDGSTSISPSIGTRSGRAIGLPISSLASGNAKV
jgi:hypothetical protein